MTITREIRIEERLNDPTRYDLTTLTAAERLFIWRHRQPSTSERVIGRAGSVMSQAEAAEHLKIYRGAYSKLENGFRSGLSAEEVDRLSLAIFDVEPTIGELCFIARRRSGLVLTTIEVELQVSRPQFHKLERAGSHLVVQFWEKRGFRFRKR